MTRFQKDKIRKMRKGTMNNRFICKKLSVILIFVLSLYIIVSALAVPSRVILIRHADKLTQADPGPFLSPKGQIRAIAFAAYYLKTFKEPDYIFATSPKSSGPEGSMREMQTIAPLANQLAELHGTIVRNYRNKDIPQLIHDLLHNSQYDGKTILICCHHTKIPELLKRLGNDNEDARAKISSINFKTAFDTVFVTDYDKNGLIKKLDIRQQQYGVSFNGSWDQVYNQVIKM